MALPQNDTLDQWNKIKDPNGNTQITAICSLTKIPKTQNGEKKALQRGAEKTKCLQKKNERRLISIIMNKSQF